MQASALAALALLGAFALTRAGRAQDGHDVSPVTPLGPTRVGADPSTPAAPRRDRSRRVRDARLTDPRSPSMYSTPFCDASARPVRAPHDHVAGDKWAELVWDSSCSHHDLRCVRGGIAGGVAAPTGCAEVRFYDGETLIANDENDTPLACARCPEHTDTDGSFGTCSDQQVEWAQAGVRPFDVRAADRARWDAAGPAALLTVRSRSATDEQKRLAQLTLLDIVREIADSLGYCRDAQPFLPGTVADHPEATYVSGRVDLNQSMVWGGRTEAEQTGMEIGAVDGIFHVYANGVSGPVPGGGEGFSVDTIAMELVHEMRHMATYNHGDGERSQPPAIMDAEHRVNEAEDYDMMFLHPYFHIIPDDLAARVKADFLFGRAAELECLASVWPVDAASHGYPPDTSAAPAPAMMMGMGLMGLGMPMGLGVRPGAGSVVAPMSAPASRPERCFAGTPLTNDQRCHVAAWSRSNVVMRSLMLRSIGMTENAQPWNTLAHWSLLLPFRMRAACNGDHYVGGPARPPRPAGRRR